MIDRVFPQTEIVEGIAVQLSGLIMYESDLFQCRIPNAYLSGADLSRASEYGAILISTNLSDCTIAATSFRLVDFIDVSGLSQQNVNDSFGVRAGYGQTLLPADITAPEHWFVAESADRDSPKLRARYEAAYQEWRETLV